MEEVYSQDGRTKIGKNGEFIPGFPICQGCENLTVGAGWFCAFKPLTKECEYPDQMPPIDSARKDQP